MDRIDLFCNNHFKCSIEDYIQKYGLTCVRNKAKTNNLSNGKNKFTKEKFVKSTTINNNKN